MVWGICFIFGYLGCRVHGIPQKKRNGIARHFPTTTVGRASCEWLLCCMEERTKTECSAASCLVVGSGGKGRQSRATAYKGFWSFTEGRIWTTQVTSHAA